MGPGGEGGSCSGGVGTSLLGGGSIPGPGCGSWSGGSRSGAGGASGSPPGGACGDGGSGSRTGAGLGGWGAGLGSGGTGMAGTSTLMMERMYECGGNLVGDGNRHAHAEGIVGYYFVGQPIFLLSNARSSIHSSAVIELKVSKPTSIVVSITVGQVAGKAAVTFAPSIHQFMTPGPS